MFGGSNFRLHFQQWIREKDWQPNTCLLDFLFLKLFQKSINQFLQLLYFIESKMPLMISIILVLERKKNKRLPIKLWYIIDSRVFQMWGGE